MGFISPLLLWLLPLAFLPIIIHLLNKRNFISIDFSTIRFLKLIEKESIQKIQLLQYILLFIRTLIIILIILMSSRPILNNLYKTNNDNALHIIILDDSFSMKYKKEFIFTSVNKLLNTIPDKNKIIWINTNGGLQYNGFKEDISNINKYIKSTYLSTSFDKSIKLLNSLINNTYSTKELYIITDNEISSIENINLNINNLKEFNKYLLITPPINDNIAITNLKILNKIFAPNQTIELEVEIENNGTNDQSNKLIQLIVNNTIVAQQLISLKSNESKIIRFKTAIAEHGKHKCKIELEIDSKIDDNYYYFTIDIQDKQNIALISNSKEETLYLKKSLQALNKYNTSLKITEYNSINQDMINLNTYNIIFLFESNSISLINSSNIEEYINNGGHLIIFPSSNTNQNIYSNIINISTSIEDDYTNLNLPTLINDSYQEIDIDKINDNSLHKIFTDQLRNIKYFKYLSLPYRPNISMLQLFDGSSIWNRYTIQSGLIDIFGYAIDLNWTSLPIKGAFLPLNHFLIYSNSQSYNDFYRHTNNNWKINLKSYYKSDIYHIDSKNEKNIVLINNNNQIIVNQLNYPGFHYINTDNKDIDLTAVNVPANELISSKLTLNDMEEILSSNFLITELDINFINKINKARFGTELWRYILYLLIFFIFLEMYLSNAKKK